MNVVHISTIIPLDPDRSALLDAKNRVLLLTLERLVSRFDILAGDIDVKARGISWAMRAFPCPVLYVPGNHEYFGGHLFGTLAKMRVSCAASHVQVLDRDVVEIGDVRFLGATAWTDFSATGNTPLASITAQSSMNDYRLIRTGENYRRIKPGDLAAEARKTRNWFLSKLAEPFSGQTIVITHHAPLMRSLVENPHSGGHLDAAYANECGFHGHPATHSMSIWPPIPR
ncbi:MAG: serine/threonine protein phosphatase [Gammaproteobacteria bacterium]|nr:serine/threonine protein phosphatase [Gammaproteobacteria bacterium]